MKKFVVIPQMLKLLGNPNGKTIIELGCGSGYWLKVLSELGAKCVGVDSSESQIALAKETVSKVQFQIAKAEEYQGSVKFDVVLISRVIIENYDTAIISKLLINANNLLNTSGKLLLVEQHPSAPYQNFDWLEMSKDFNYFANGSTYEAKSGSGNNIVIHSGVYWNIETLVNFVTSSGFFVEKLESDHVTDALAQKYPDLSDRVDKPSTIFILATKRSE